MKKGDFIEKSGMKKVENQDSFVNEHSVSGFMCWNNLKIGVMSTTHLHRFLVEEQKEIPLSNPKSKNHHPCIH